MKYFIYCFFILFSVNNHSFAQTNFNIIKSGHPSTKFKKILVISLNKIYEDRKTVENEISWWLNNKEFMAYSYNKLTDAQELPSSKLINDVVAENNFDAILVSDITDVQMKERYENNQRQNNYNPSAPLFYNFLESYNNAYKLGYNYNTKSYLIQTRLFEVKSEAVVFESSSDTYESINLDKAIENYSKSLANALKKSKLLEKREQKH